MKIVIHCNYGSFSLSNAGLEYYYRLKGVRDFYYYGYVLARGEVIQYEKVTKDDKSSLVEVFSKDFGSDSLVEISKEDQNRYGLSRFEIGRDDPMLVKTVEDLGDEAGRNLRIVEIPDDVKWIIEEYDGDEWVAEVHRTWS